MPSNKTKKKSKIEKNNEAEERYRELLSNIVVTIRGSSIAKNKGSKDV